MSDIFRAPRDRDLRAIFSNGEQLPVIAFRAPKPKGVEEAEALILRYGEVTIAQKHTDFLFISDGPPPDALCVKCRHSDRDHHDDDGCGTCSTTTAPCFKPDYVPF